MHSIKDSKNVSPIQFKEKLLSINSWTILKLPKDASSKLPSRGMTMVDGTINGLKFRSPLEPDGMGSHWFKVEETIFKAINVSAGDTVTLELLPTKEWTEPNVPNDLKIALEETPIAQSLWTRITPNSRWDWIRWIRFTKNQETRKHRIEVTCSKLKSGERRPCCFNRNMSSEPHVSKNGVLLSS